MAGGAYSFAAGRRARVSSSHSGTFLLADSNNFNFVSTASDEFAVRATGGFRFVTDIDTSGNPTKTIRMDNGAVEMEGFRLGTTTTSGYVLTADSSGWGTWQEAADGDITKVTASTGLSGGGSDGDVSLYISSAYRLPQSCPSGNIPQWNGSSWTCADDQDSGGTITEVVAGEGLEGGGSSDSITISLAPANRLPAGCDEGELPQWNKKGTWTCSQNLRLTDRLTASASGGILLRTGETSGVEVVPGGSMWRSLSDRNLKENFKDVDGRIVLEDLMAVPISIWNYKSQDETIHHMGPMAQDFYATFGLGEDDRHIGTLDADGVALAAIQGLYGIVEEKSQQLAEQKEELIVLRASNTRALEEIASLKNQLAALQARDRAYETRLAQFEAQLSIPPARKR